MSDFSNISKIALSVGGPIASLFLGPSAGLAVNALSKVINPLLGLEDDDPETLNEAAISDSDLVRDAINKVSSDPELLERFSAEYNAIISTNRETNETYRVELKSESFIARNWRPIHGLELTIEMAVWGFIVLRAVYLGGPVAKATIANIYELSAILGPWYTARLAVMGVHVFGRSQEKVAAMGGIPGTLVNQIVRAIKK